MNIRIPDIGIVTGFIGSKGMDRLMDALNEKVNPYSCTLIPSAPLGKAFMHPEAIIRDVSERVDMINSRDLVLIGHSYGALIALVVACRRQMEGISRLFLIDGPLNSHTKVAPSKLLHNLFFRHYANREPLARECEDVIAGFDSAMCAKIVSMGSGLDNVVPPPAKILPGNLDFVLLSHDDDVKPNFLGNSRGHNVVLPASYKGHSISKRVPIVSDIIRYSLGS